MIRRSTVVLVVTILLTSAAVLGAGPRLNPETSMARRPNLRTKIGRPIAATFSASASCPFGKWMTTSGPWIITSTGCKVRLAGVTLFGTQTDYYIPSGLDYLTYKQIIDKIAAMGFNSIRIPLSDYLVRYNKSLYVGCRYRHGCKGKTKPAYLKADPGLKGEHPLQLLDQMVKYAAQKHLWIIFDNHVSNPVSAKQIHTQDETADPVWTAKGFTQQDWINDWVTVARRYRNQPAVIGFDLRNEPHTAGPAPGGWKLKTYLTQGSTWGRCTIELCGKYTSLWKESTNWPDAAAQCANQILKVNPHLLTFIEGLQLYPNIDKSHPKRVDQYWWGSILKGIKVDPVQLANASYDRQIVYSSHEWGPWKYRSPQFYDHPTKASFDKLFAAQWAFILKMKPAHPIWLGEFNTCNNVDTHIRCVSNPKHKGSQGWWFQFLVNYLRQNPEIGWSYYPINGTNSLDKPSNNSILNKHWACGTDCHNIMKTLDPILQRPQ